MTRKEFMELAFPENLNVALRIIAQFEDKSLICMNNGAVMTRTILSALPDRSAKILLERYAGHKTFKEIADQYGVTIERIRRVVHKSERALLEHITSSAKTCCQDNIRETSVLDYLKLITDEREGISIRTTNAIRRAYKSGLYASKITINPYLTCDLKSDNSVLRSVRWCETVGDLVRLVRSGEIMNIRNFGEKSRKYLVKRLLADGITKEELGIWEDSDE